MTRHWIILLLVVAVAGGCASPKPAVHHANSPVSGGPVLSVAGAKLNTSWKGNDLILTQKIEFWIHDRGQSPYVVSESRYLLDDQGRQVGNVARTIRKTAGFHSSSYSFVVPNATQMKSTYRFAAKLIVGKDNKVVWNDFTPGVAR